MLPANLTLLPGVRSDHLGRKYQYGQYPSGKRIIVPVQEQRDAPPARMIPVPAEPKPRINGKVVTTDSGDGRKVPVLPPRLHCIEARTQGQITKAEMEDRIVFEQVLIAIKPMMRSPDCGKTWIPVEPVTYDWHVCYHKDK